MSSKRILVKENILPMSDKRLKTETVPDFEKNDVVLSEQNFITPTVTKSISVLKRTTTTDVLNDSPFVIPASPLMKRLGCGSYVTVYRYKRTKQSGPAASPWAIKKAKKGHARPDIMDRLKEEGKVLKTLRHPNIILFKKLTKTPAGDICLSMEEGGKGLDDIICKRQDADVNMFTPNEIMKVTWYLAKALDYLHTIKKLLHADIKSGNVLIKGEFEQVKLCDFGVSIFLKDDLSGPKDPKAYYVGSEPWNSKEILEQNIITDKADIFAYGLVIWEMLALDVPHTALMREDSNLDGSYTEDDSYSIPQSYYDALGTRPPLPDVKFSEKYDTIIGVYICCTNENYKQRPCALKLVESLVGVIDEYGIKE